MSSENAMQGKVLIVVRSVLNDRSWDSWEIGRIAWSYLHSGIWFLQQLVGITVEINIYVFNIKSRLHNIVRKDKKLVKMHQEWKWDRLISFEKCLACWNNDELG